MAQLISKTWPGTILPSGLRVPAKETVETTNEALRQTDNARVIPVLIAAGDIEVIYDPDPEPQGVQALVSIEAPAPAAAPAEAAADPTPETPAEPVAEAPARKK